MTPWRHHARRARFAATTLVAVVLIGAAVAIGLVQLLLPLATHYPNWIAGELAARLHRPVEFTSITSQWQPSGPLLTVHNLTLGPGKPGGQSITLPHAALKFDFGAWLHPAHRWITLRVSGMELRIKHAAGGWQLDGFGASANASHASLQSLPVDLDLRDLRVDIVDAVTGHSWQLFAPRLRVINNNATLRFAGVVRQRGTSQSVTLKGWMDTASHDYDLYVATRALDLAAATRGIDLHGYTVQHGQGDIELWGSWRDNKLVSAAARYALHGIATAGPDGRSIEFASLAGVVNARRVTGGWNLAWRGPGKPRADIDEVGGVVAQLRGHHGAWRVNAAARAVDVAPWLSLLAILPQAPPKFASWVVDAQPHLTIDSAALAWHQGGHYDATVRFSDVHAAATGRLPGVALARGTLRADNEAVSLQLPSQAATLALTDVFRKPFLFKQFGGTFVAWRQDGSWRIAADSLHFDAGSFAGDADATLVWLGHGQRPFLSAYATVQHAKVKDADRFWPDTMPPSLIKWLDHALVAGDVTSGRVLLRGPLDAWPFLHHEGRFEAVGTVKDATFDFADDWPRATGVDAAVDFIDNHLGIVATHAKVRGVTATHAVATIPDLDHGVLGLDIRGGGTGAELLDFVRHSPVGADALDALQGITIGGKGNFAIKLAIPLDHADDFKLDGKVDLANADVTADKWHLALQGLTGPLQIQGKGFRADNLAATFRGAPAKLSLAVGSGVADPKDIVEASLATKASLQSLVQGYPDLASLVSHASGAAPFRVGVKVVAGQGSAPATPILDVRSTLVGIKLDFPAPLHKPAATSLPLHLTLRLPPAGAPLTVSLGDVLQVRGRLADAARKQPAALAVNFGGALPASLPASGLVVEGHAKRLDVSGWIDQAMRGGGGTFPALTRAHVSTDDAEVFGTALGALQFDFNAGTNSDSIAFDGDAVKGTLRLPATSHSLLARGISADFDRLYWPAPPPSKQPAPSTPPTVTSPIAPATLPPLHVTVRDLRLGNMHLGSTEFESAPTLAGMHVAKFDSKGKDFTIHAHGDWNGTTAYSQSHFVIGITAKDFGNTLTAFGFKGLLAGGKDAQVDLNGNWPGAPSSFSLAWMDGSLAIKMGEGRILAVKPGLGRLLGLLSVRELPSRLLLHFGDVFKSGFGFDHASATFALKGGNAVTRDMLIEAPAARITMQGRVGFRARDFDLTVKVLPHVSGTLPVVGAVIGGPVGAAAGLVVQGLLGKGINKAAGSAYRVTGSWDAPSIVKAGSIPATAASVGSAASPAVPAAATSGG